jgi:glycosyltransferase involved in cell wall biosynthesis
MTRTGGRVAFVLKGYPRLSETFIAQEILALERRGLDILIVSLRHPTDTAIHPVHRQIAAERLYLPEYLYQEPLRVWRSWRKARRLPGYKAARRVWLADLVRDKTPNRIRRFGQALVLAAELPADVDRLHAHFIHTPASVTRYAAAVRGLQWSLSAHAKDIWTTPDWEQREKLADASWAVTCTGIGHEHLAGQAPEPRRVALCYHGLDLYSFPPPLPPRGNADDPVTILSVGRAVAKKGYDDLLAALALLPANLDWRFVHVGGGALASWLKAEAERLGLAGRIEWRGGRPQPDVLDAYRAADIFVLASKIAPDGDRDGLPNVLMEAQSQRLACVATDLAGIPELIEDEVSGLLVPPADPAALAAALARLIGDPALRARLGAAGEQRVRHEFDADSTIDLLAARFGLMSPQPAPSPRELVDAS